MNIKALLEDQVEDTKIEPILAEMEDTSRCYAIEEMRKNMRLVHCQLSTNSFAVLWFCLALVITSLTLSLLFLYVLRQQLHENGKSLSGEVAYEHMDGQTLQMTTIA